jgi:hypothetical protein
MSIRWIKKSPLEVFGAAFLTDRQARCVCCKEDLSHDEEHWFSLEPHLAVFMCEPCYAERQAEARWETEVS